MSIKLVMPSNHFILCQPLLLPSIFPSIRVFSNESVLHIRWSKYWSFSLSITPSNEYSGLIPFKMDWFDLLEIQGTLKSFLQHHSSKASIHQLSAFFTVLECKSRKSRNTRSNRQIWPWNVEGSRAKTNRILPRKCTGQKKKERKKMHGSQQTPSSNNTREDFTHGHHQMVNTKIRLVIFFAAKDGEALYSQQKTRLWLRS